MSKLLSPKTAKFVTWLYTDFQYVPVLVGLCVCAKWILKKDDEALSRYRGKSKLYGPITDPNTKPW